MGGQWAIRHGPLYEVFMVYGRIYLYGRSAVVHTCLYIRITRDREGRIRGGGGRKAKSRWAEILLGCLRVYRRGLEITFDPFLYLLHSFVRRRLRSFSRLWLLFLVVLRGGGIGFANDRAADIDNYSLQGSRAPFPPSTIHRVLSPRSLARHFRRTHWRVWVNGVVSPRSGIPSSSTPVYLII